MRSVESSSHPPKEPCVARTGRSDVIVGSYDLSTHARTRLAQRGLSEADLRYVLRYGRLHYAGSAVIYFLGKADIPTQDRRQCSRLEGVAAITSYEGTVITIWRNRKHGMKNIRHKLALGEALFPSPYANYANVVDWDQVVTEL
jgi:hypothetical protein